MLNFICYPKVNIFLIVFPNLDSVNSSKNKVYAPRVNNLHRISSRFCLVKGELFDEVKIELSNRLEIIGNFDCKMEDNLIFKAIKLLENTLRSKGMEASILSNLRISVKKKIPAFAGLGSGSSNAGKILYELNKAFFGLSYFEIIDIAKCVGSDVSFFASGFESANVSSFGEEVSEFSEARLDFKIIASGVKCNTKSIFSHFKTSPNFLKFGLDPIVDVAPALESLEDFSNTLKEMPSLEILQKFDRFALNSLLPSALVTNSKLRDFEAKLGQNYFFSGSGGSFFTWI